MNKPFDSDRGGRRHPVAILDAQSGERKAGGYVSGLQASATGDNGIYGHFGRIANRPYDDAGGASRFFPTFAFEADDFAPFLYVAKAARSERDHGLQRLAVMSAAEMTGRAEGSAGLANPRAGTRTRAGARNHHPTVKPVALMRWLVRLVTPPGETVLDNFGGSGTTGRAALMEGRDVIIIEREPAYLPIIRRRLETTQPGFGLASD